MADLEDIDNVAPADSLKVGADKINLIRARVDGLYTVLSDITAAEATQIEALGTTTISAAQWVYLGALDQSLITSDSPTFANITISGLTSGRVIFATTNGQLTDDADMTFSTDTLTVKKIALNDATTASTDMLTLTPGGAVAAGATWKGIYVNGAALDPAGANAEIEGIYVDLSGVATANSPEMRGVYASVPAGLGYEALHIIGKIKLDNDESTLAPGETATGVDIIVSASGASGGEYHAIDVATTGTSSASLTALATHTGIDVIHQHTGSFISPTKAWKFDDSGSSYADVTTAFGSAGTDVTIFEDDDDAIFIGADTAFDEIEVILATSASVDIKPTFWYSKAATFTRFFPADDTEGFTQDGTIRFDADDLTDFAAQSVNGTSKYYIKVIRTRNNVVTDPIEDTIKTLVATECFWNNVGAVQVVSIAVPTITTVTTFTASGNLDIGAYSFRAQTLLADGLTSGRVVFSTTNGQLTDDSDLTFSTATLSATNVTSSGTITTAALVATAHLDIGTYNFRCNGLIDDSLTSGRVIFATTNGQLADDSDMTFSVATLTIANITSSGTITTAGITATSNIDIGAYNFRAQNLTADSIPSGRVLFTTTNGQLTSDSDITFATDTLTVTKIAAFELTGKLTAGATEIEGSGFDINGGTVDGAIIGANSAAALTCTTFTSTGIDDNADTMVITIDSNEKVFINDTTNAFATGPSLTISGDENDGEYICLKDKTDVAHGMTDHTETDTFGVLKKTSNDAGGLSVVGYRDADGAAEGALVFAGRLGEAANTGKEAGTTGRGVFRISAEVKNGTDIAVVGANGNLISIENAGSVRFIFDAEGEMHSDAIIGIGDDWDEWDDLALASDLSRLPKAKFNEMMKYKAQDFERAGLLTLSVDEKGTHHAFIKNKAMHQFAMCCFADIHDRLTRYEKAFDKLGINTKELLALGV